MTRDALIATVALTMILIGVVSAAVLAYPMGG